MAIDPSAVYPTQVDTSDPTGYPYGKPQNVTVPGDGSGTPLEETWLSDLFGFLQALLGEASATPSGTPDKVGASQYVDAILGLTRSITPAAIGANQNDYAPAGHGTATVERLSASAAYNVTGLSATVSVKVKVLVNIGTFSITLKNQDAGSTAANRFACPDSVDYVLTGGESVVVWHDATTECWRVLGFAPNKARTFDGDQTFGGDILLSGGAYHNRLHAGTAAVLTEPSEFTLAGGDLQFSGTGSFQALWPLNGFVWSDAELQIFKAHYSWSAGTGTYAFTFFSTDKFGDDVVTHETVALVSPTSKGSATLTVSPSVAFQPYDRLYYLTVSVTGATAENMTVHSVEHQTAPTMVIPG